MTTNAQAIVLSTGAEAETKEAKTWSRTVLAMAQTAKVTDPTTFQTAAEIIQEAKRQWKALDERKRQITGPLQDALRSVTALFQPALADWTEVERLLKVELASYTVRVEEEKRAALAKAAEEYAQGGTPLLAAIPEVAEAKGINVRTVRKWEVTDPDRVPRQFCSPDETKIRAHLAAGGLEAIPGVRFYDHQIVTART